MFQLVLQFAPWADADLEDLVRLEEQLSAVVPSDAIDGHDLGSDEANIFILTEDPKSMLSACSPVIREAGLFWKFSAGCRAVDQDEYVRLWPAGDASTFSVA